MELRAEDSEEMFFFKKNVKLKWFGLFVMLLGYAFLPFLSRDDDRIKCISTGTTD